MCVPGLIVYLIKTPDSVKLQFFPAFCSPDFFNWYVDMLTAQGKLALIINWLEIIVQLIKTPDNDACLFYPDMLNCPPWKEY